MRFETMLKMRKMIFGIHYMQGWTATNINKTLSPTLRTFAFSLDSQDFWRIANSVLSKNKSAITPLLNTQEVLTSASNKKMFTTNFTKNSNLDDLNISLLAFPSRTNL